MKVYHGSLYHLNGHGAGGVWLEINPVLVRHGLHVGLVQDEPGPSILGQLLQHVVVLVKKELNAETWKTELKKSWLDFSTHI